MDSLAEESTTPTRPVRKFVALSEITITDEIDAAAVKIEEHEADLQVFEDASKNKIIPANLIPGKAVCTVAWTTTILQKGLQVPMSLKYLFRCYLYKSNRLGCRIIANELSADRIHKAEGGRGGHQSQGNVMGSSAPAVSSICFANRVFTLPVSLLYFERHGHPAS